ncbi:hypothetical protein ACGFZA_37740 [Streptomyces sp. NPDC048211]|uniref:hypothetical protein n=1 Tax=Streptomyces sp. NPDC048211 TaxID=3365516 RepID=UPI00371CB667
MEYGKGSRPELVHDHLGIDLGADLTRALRAGEPLHRWVNGQVLYANGGIA